MRSSKHIQSPNVVVPFQRMYKMIMIKYNGYTYYVRSYLTDRLFLSLRFTLTAPIYDLKTIHNTLEKHLKLEFLFF